MTQSAQGLRAMLIGSTLVASWLGMQAIHECGHVLTAWFTGGEVECVVLHPLTISRTDLRYNHRPLETAWGGRSAASSRRWPSGAWQLWFVPVRRSCSGSGQASA